MRTIKRKSVMFDEKQLNEAGNSLKAIIIKTIMNDKITLEKFMNMHRDYLLNMGTSTKKIAYDRSNLLKALLYNKETTYRTFVYIMKNILGYNLVGLSAKLKSVDNKNKTVEIKRMTY